jgi:putative transposase
MDANYPTDLTDEQWQAIWRLVPPAKPGGRPRKVDMRQVLNGLFYIARTGCAWRMLPKEYPPRDTIYYYSSSKFGSWRPRDVRCWAVME